MKKLTVTAELSTKDRYFTTLPVALTSIATQTVTVDRLFIFDDGEHRDLRNESIYNNLFALFQRKNIDWKVIYGERRGQVANHQKAIEMAETDLIWRVDDDDCCEPNVLEHLLSAIEPTDVGAVSGRVWVPASQPLQSHLCSGRIEDLFGKPNLQWSNLTQKTEVDHLNNTFLYRRAYATHGYCRELSPVGHSEESLFTYGFRRQGYKVLIEPKALIWHLREQSGGIRSYQDANLWAQDSETALRLFKSYGVCFENYKLIILNSGLGDHICFKMVLPELLERYKDHKIIIGACYPDLFKEDNVQVISIADALAIDPDEAKHNVYKFLWDHPEVKTLLDGFRALYL